MAETKPRFGRGLDSVHESPVGPQDRRAYQLLGRYDSISQPLSVISGIGSTGRTAGDHTRTMGCGRGGSLTMNTLKKSVAPQPAVSGRSKGLMRLPVANDHLEA
jgi:hypothetical protein